MSVVASVHIADVGVASALPFAINKPRVGSIPGLRDCNVAIAAELAAGRRRPPMLGRVALIAVWDDDASLGRFLDSHPIARKLATGWHARLDPIRLYGSWPGVPDDIGTERAATHEGPAVVLTLGRLRLSQLPRFLKASGGAERSATSARGMLWGTALARPPFVATCSIWESGRAINAYAYAERVGHPQAITEQQRKDFHKRSAFIRFRPYDVHGSLGGRNPLPAASLTA